MLKLSDPQVFEILKEVDPSFAELLSQQAETILEFQELSLKERSLISIACDVYNQTLGEPFDIHVQMALDNGATRQDIKEVFLHLTVYAAFPKCLQAIARLKEIYAKYDEQDLYATSNQLSHPKPEINLIWDTNVKDALREFDLEFGDLAVRVAGEVWQRPGLTLKERLFITLAGDVCNQTLFPDGPFDFHIGMSFEQGLTVNQLRQLLLYLTIDVGFPKVLTAFQAFNVYLGKLDNS